jgi:hypothetical protein
MNCALIWRKNFIIEFLKQLEAIDARLLCGKLLAFRHILQIADVICQPPWELALIYEFSLDVLIERRVSRQFIATAGCEGECG